MLKISRLADYATVIISQLVNTDSTVNAKQIAELAHIALPTVTKVLKLLTKANLLRSTQGSSGGYRLAREAHLISLLEVIQAIETQLALTECSLNRDCALEPYCAVQKNWQTINQIIQSVLANITLQDLVNTSFHPKLETLKQPVGLELL